MQLFPWRTCLLGKWLKYSHNWIDQKYCMRRYYTQHTQLLLWRTYLLDKQCIHQQYQKYLSKKHFHIHQSNVT